MYTAGENARYRAAAPRPPIARPVVRRTLVAPMFPLPPARTSLPVVIFTSRNPDGIRTDQVRDEQCKESGHGLDERKFREFRVASGPTIR